MSAAATPNPRAHTHVPLPTTRTWLEHLGRCLQVITGVSVHWHYSSGLVSTSRRRASAAAGRGAVGDAELRPRTTTAFLGSHTELASPSHADGVGGFWV